MAVKFFSVSGLLCEKVLQERETIFSAIRIIDIFGVPEGTPAGIVQFSGLVLLRAMPTEEQFRVSVAIISSSGERIQLPDPPGNPFSLPVYEGDPTIPVGFSLHLEFHVGTGKMGTNYIEISVDGVPVLQMPFTLQRIPAPSPPAAL
jgi:hypothetical protein